MAKENLSSTLATAVLDRIDGYDNTASYYSPTPSRSDPSRADLEYDLKTLKNDITQLEASLLKEVAVLDDLATRLSPTVKTEKTIAVNTGNKDKQDIYDQEALSVANSGQKDKQDIYDQEALSVANSGQKLDPNDPYSDPLIAAMLSRSPKYLIEPLNNKKAEAKDNTQKDIIEDLLPDTYRKSQPNTMTTKLETIIKALAEEEKAKFVANISTTVDKLTATLEGFKDSKLSSEAKMRIIAALLVSLPSLPAPQANSANSPTSNLSSVSAKQAQTHNQVDTILTAVHDQTVIATPEVQEQFKNIISTPNFMAANQNLIHTLSSVTKAAAAVNQTPDNKITIVAIGHTTNAQPSATNQQTSLPTHSQTSSNLQSQAVAIAAPSPQAIAKIINQINQQASTLLFDPTKINTSAQPKIDDRELHGQDLQTALAAQQITGNQLVVEVVAPANHDVASKEDMSVITTTTTVAPTTTTTVAPTTTTTVAPTTTTTTTPNNNQLSGTNQLATYNDLTKQFGLSSLVAAGMMGSLQVESYLNPVQLQNNSPGIDTPYQTLSSNIISNNQIGWGLQMSTPADKIVNEFKEFGISLNDLNNLQAQLEDYIQMLHQPVVVNGQVTTYFDYIQTLPTSAQIAYFLEDRYERPFVVNPAVESYAQDFYNYFVSGLALPANIKLTYPAKS